MDTPCSNLTSENPIPPPPLLLPGNEIVLYRPTTPLNLPPILPSIQVPESPIQVVPPGPSEPPEPQIISAQPGPVYATTKRGKSETTRDQRIKIQAYYEAGQSIEWITSKLGLTKRQVWYALDNRVTPQRKNRGRNVVLDTPTRQRIIGHISLNRRTRREQWDSILLTLGLSCGPAAIATAMLREGYCRAVARTKPAISGKTKLLD
jgi:hypothetical protein